MFVDLKKFEGFFCIWKNYGQLCIMSRALCNYLLFWQYSVIIERSVGLEPIFLKNEVSRFSVCYLTIQLKERYSLTGRFTYTWFDTPDFSLLRHHTLVQSLNPMIAVLQFSSTSQRQDNWVCKLILKQESNFKLKRNIFIRNQSLGNQSINTKTSYK